MKLTQLRLLLLAPVAAILVACGGAAAPAAPVDNAPATVAAAPTDAVDTPVADTPVADAQAATDTPAAETAEPAVVATVAKLNLNTVTPDELLATIPDFGNRMVREFQEYRPYVSIQQFRREIGKYVDDDQVAFYEQYVYVPVDGNEADAATLQQLPGVDETVAAELIAARPYATNDDFLAKLGELTSADNAAAAGAYLVTP